MTKIVYPAAISYDFMHQRAAQILKAMSRIGYETYFVNKNVELPGARTYKKKTKKAHNHYVLPEKTDIDSLSPFIYFYSYPPNINDIKFKPQLKIFDSVDEPSGVFQFWNMNGEYEESLKTADLVLCTSKFLYDKAKKYTDNPIRVPNGCEFDHFHKDFGIKPRIFKETKGPVITYMGAIASWVDIDLIIESAKAYPKYTFLIIGGTLNEFIHNPPKNLKLLGHINYHQLPPYLHNSDVLTIPFDPSQPEVQATDPIKLYEYCCTGKPIVTTAMPETKLRGIYWSKDKAEYISNIEVAIQEDGMQYLRRHRYAKQNTWDARASIIHEEIQRLL